MLAISEQSITLLGMKLRVGLNAVFGKCLPVVFRLGVTMLLPVPSRCGLAVILAVACTFVLLPGVGSSAWADDPPTEGEGSSAASVSGEQAPADADDSPTVSNETDLGETTVTAEQLSDETYITPRASTATKTNALIIETPVSVQVVPRQVIEDQAALRLEDVYENVSGVTQAGNTLNAQSEVLPFIRGFESPVLFRNGMRATTAGAVDLVNIESVEVLKGPASVLFGAIEPGGILNYTTKQPEAEPFIELNQQFGSYDHYRTTVDANTPLNDEGTVMFRFNGAYTNSGSFRDHIDLERWAFAPSLLIRPHDRTEILFEFQYTREEQPYDTGVPFGFDDEPLVDPSTFFNATNLKGRRIDDIYAGVRLEHELDKVFTLRSQFQFHRAKALNEALRPRGVRGTPGAEELRRRYQNEDRTDDEYQWVNELLAEFGTGGIKHNALVGVDLIYQESDFFRFRQNLPNLIIDGDPPSTFTPPSPQSPDARLGETRWASVYVQDHMTLLEDDSLHVLLGGRFDYVEQEFSNNGVASPNVYDSKFTGRGGVLYDLTDYTSPYASISQSFRPPGTFAVDQGGTPLDPEEGIQYEVGLKNQFFDDRLLVNIAAFQIDKENVPVFDNDFFNNTGMVAFFPGVEQRSRGIELDVTGQISDTVSVIANYAYIDTETVRNDGDPASEGNRLGNVPLHSTRVWLAYNFAEGTDLEGLGFGAGLRYVSDFMAEFDDTMLDEYITFDAGIWYRKTLRNGNRLKMQCNVRNLFDNDFYVRASAQDIVHPGEPVSVFGSIGIEFR